MDEGRAFFIVRRGALDSADDFQRGTYHIVQIYARTAREDGEQRTCVALFECNLALRVGRSRGKGNQRTADRKRSSGKAHEGNLIPGNPTGIKGERYRPGTGGLQRFVRQRTRLVKMLWDFCAGRLLI